MPKGEIYRRHFHRHRHLRYTGLIDTNRPILIQSAFPSYAGPVRV